MKFREPVPILLKKKKKKLATAANSSAAAAAAAAAEAAVGTHTDIDMSHSTSEQPTFGEDDESDALPSDAIAAAELDDLRDRRVCAARLGCVLHILHIGRCYCRDDQHILHGPTRQGPVERVGKRSRVLPSRPRTRAFSPKLLFQPFSAALWLHGAVDVLPRATSPPQRALPSL